MEWKIGNVKIDNQVVIAPMAGISNSAFRRLAKEFGAGLIYTEMVSDKAIVYGNEKTIDMLYMDKRERPIAQQIFGSDKKSFVEAAKYVEKNMKPDIIDINMGCPVPKVALRSQAGAALLKDPDRVYEIVKAVVDAVDIPVTVKIRSGWDEKNINAVEITKLCEKAGASAIAIHGRTRKQGYTGKVDLDIIKSVVEAVNIPVIGNGDILTFVDAKRMLDYTGCRAVMIGRGVLGNLFLINEVKLMLDGELVPTVYSIFDKLNIAIRHMDYLIELKGEKRALLEMRGLLFYYIKGMPNTKKLKQGLMKIETRKMVIDLFDEYMEGLK